MPLKNEDGGHDLWPPVFREVGLARGKGEDAHSDTYNIIREWEDEELQDYEQVTNV